MPTVKNLYPNLPGHLVEFRDGGLQLSSNPEEENGYGKSLLILGTALDGPINEPTEVLPDTVEDVFGSDVNENGYPNGATLVKHAKQAFKQGFSDVRCMRVTGTQASVEVEKTVSEETEEVAGFAKTVIIEGTDPVANPVVVKLTAAPIVNRSSENKAAINLSIVQDNGETTQYNASIDYSEYPANGKPIEIKIKESVIKNPTFEAEYLYKRIYDAQGAINDLSDGSSFKDLEDYHIANTSNVVDYQPAIDRNRSPLTNLISDGDTITASDGVWTSIQNDDTGGFVTYYLPFDPADNNGTSVYQTPYVGEFIADKTGKLPITENAPLVLYVRDSNGETRKLTFGNDKDFYLKLVNHPDGIGQRWEIVFNPDVLTADDDSIRVEYYIYDTVKVTETYISAEDPTRKKDVDDIVVISPVPVQDSITVSRIKSDTVEVLPSSSYDVVYDTLEDQATISFPAGKFNKGTELEITYSVRETSTEHNSFVLVAKNGGQIYNGARMDITVETRDGQTGRRFTFTKPESKLFGVADKPFYFTSFECQTVGDLKVALNRYELNNVFDIDATDEDLLLEDFPPQMCILSGGEDGLKPTNNEMFKALSGERDKDNYLIKRGAYQILENYHVNYIYVGGVYKDSQQTVNRHSSFHYELALLCAVLSYRTKTTHGFMDVKPNSNTTLVGVQNYVEHLINLPNTLYMKDLKGNDIVNKSGDKMDIGQYTSIVVGPDPIIVSDTLGRYYGSSALAYAALCASLRPESAPTNKALPGAVGMKFRFSNAQANALVGNRMVCFKLKNEGERNATAIPYCTDGVTAGAPGSDYTRISTVQVVNYVVDRIRDVCDPFIGEPNTSATRNAMSSLITKELKNLLEAQVIGFYDFEIQATLQQVLTGEVTILLTIGPPLELRRITTIVSLRPAA